MTKKGHGKMYLWNLVTLVSNKRKKKMDLLGQINKGYYQFRSSCCATVKFPALVYVILSFE